MAKLEMKTTATPGTVGTSTLMATLDNGKTSKVSWNHNEFEDADAIVALRALADLIVRKSARK